MGRRESESRAPEIHDEGFSQHQGNVSVTQLQSSDGSLHIGCDAGCPCHNLKGLGSLGLSIYFPSSSLDMYPLLE